MSGSGRGVAIVKPARQAVTRVKRPFIVAIGAVALTILELESRIE